jgi:hypothetical protein
MTGYFLEPSDETPRVNFDPENQVFEIVGNSYPENSAKIYTPILEWLDQFVKSTTLTNLVFDFNFDYFNTSSAKYILEILRSIKQLEENGKSVLIRWHYFEDDTDMQEAGEDYIATIDLPFEMIVREDTF